MVKLFEKSVIVTIYFIFSVATFVLNKYIMVDLQFSMHYLLIFIQSLIIVGFVGIQVAFTNVTIRHRNIDKWYISSILLTVMMFTNMKAIFYMSLTIFTLYKNLAVIPVAILEYGFFNKKITLIGYISFFLMVLSSIFGNTKEAIVSIGYLWMLANILATSAYIIYLKKTNGNRFIV